MRLNLSIFDSNEDKLYGSGRKKVVLESKSYTYFFLVSCVEERPRWPIQSLNKGRKKKAKG